MNKTIFSIIAMGILSSGICAGAQETCPAGAADKAACAKNYLPAKGDFAVGVDLVPLFRTIGGAFNDSETPVGGTPFEYEDMMEFRPTVSIMGKYMLTDQWGLRVNLGVRVRQQSKRNYVQDDKAVFLDPLSEAKVIDTDKKTQSGGSLMVGAEYRLGRRRVQGVFGFGAMFGFSTTRHNYSYGNEITSFNQTPSGSFETEAFVPAGYRITEYSSEGPNFAAGIYGSVGAEWFVAPKISLGAEVNLSLYGVFGSKSVAKSEGYNQAYERVDTWTEVVSPGNRGINFGTDNIGGALYCTFYF